MIMVGASSALVGVACDQHRHLVRHLLDFETSTTAGGINNKQQHHHMSKKWVVVIVIIIVVVVAMIVLLLLRRLMLLLLARRRSLSTTGHGHGMRVWTNQLSFSASDDNNSCRGSARFEIGSAKVAPWIESPTHDARDVGKGKSMPCDVPYAELQAATRNFSSANLLGEGSFGLVYKAKLEDNVSVAVKRLNGAASKHSHKEFQGEVDLMSKIRHPNLVALLGYSSDGPEPLVVYELMHNGSLHDQLHGPSRGTALTWCLRLKIALEAARGLEHLHGYCKPPIIHRDFKASNILLDANFNAKVSDFGLAVALDEGGLLKDDVQVQGTFGYIALEYLMDGTLTEKSDVYGFGVVLLELLTGRLPIDMSLPLGSQSLVTWATPLLTKRSMLMEILDPSLGASVNEKHLHQVAAVALLCVQAEASYRPLIADVVQSLLPLVPQELGGAFKSKPQAGNINTNNYTAFPDFFIDVELLESFPSQTSSHYSADDQAHSDDSSSSSSSSLGRSRSWEEDIIVSLEQHHSDNQAT